LAFGPSGFVMLDHMKTEPPWPWPETMDALRAAPASHRVLIENDRVRVLEVVIEPGSREPEHTHRSASVMIVDESARIRYYVGDDLRSESPERSAPGVRVEWLEPEGPHSVENIDERRFHAVRVELK
jgi:quercetin dioxygenase-like cupin family protein